MPGPDQVHRIRPAVTSFGKLTQDPYRLDIPGQARIEFRATDDPRLLETAGREELTAALREVVAAQ